MSDLQFYLVLGFYLYTNIFLSIYLIKKPFKNFQKVLLLLQAWFIPFFGYVIAMTIILAIEKKTIIKNEPNIGTFIALLCIYFAFYLMLTE